MAKYLLDTHVVLWWLEDPTKLSAASHSAITSPDNQILVSVATIWELVIKSTLNKLQMPTNLLERCKIQRFDLLPIDSSHVLAVSNFPLLHNDPFDRLLMAQAQIENAILITRDKHIPQYGIPLIMA
jgi:PIN domain nuclease of toxin-antitoxin system